jgi:hypothetical protein
MGCVGHTAPPSRQPQNIAQTVSSGRIAYPGISNRSARQGLLEIPNRGYGQPSIADENATCATAGHGYILLPCILIRRTSHGLPADQGWKKICHIALGAGRHGNETKHLLSIRYLQLSLWVCSTRFRIRYPPAHTCTESVICNATLLNPLSRLAFGVSDRHTPHPTPTLWEGNAITIWARRNGAGGSPGCKWTKRSKRPCLQVCTPGGCPWTLLRLPQNMCVHVVARRGAGCLMVFGVLR